MANTVEVRGGGDFDGAVLENAATEATLQRLVAAFEGRSPGSGGSVRDMYQGIKSNVAAVKQSTTAYKDSGAEVDGFGKKIKEAAGSISALSSSLLGKVFGFLNTGLDAFREASASGGAFGNSLFKLSAAAAESNLSIEEFTAQIQKNSLLFGAFGGTVTQGAKRFGQLSDTIRKDLGDQLFGMGLTVRDINDYLSAYLDIQMRSGRVRDRSDKSLITGAQNYIVELDKMSKLLGVSRKEQEAAMRKQSMDATIQQMIKNLSPEAQARSAANIAALQKAAGGGDTLVDAVKDAATLVQTDQGKAILQAIGREGAQALLKGSGNSLEIMQRLARETKRNADYFGELGTQAGGVIGSYGDLSIMLSSFLEKTPQDIAAAEEEQKQQDAITKGLAKSADAFNRIKNSLLAAFLNSPFFQKFLEGVVKLGDYLSKNAGKLIEGMTKFFGPTFDRLSKVFENFQKDMENGGVTTAISNAFTGLFAAVTPIISKIIIAAFNTIMDTLEYLWTGKAPESLTRAFNDMANALNPDEVKKTTTLNIDKLQRENADLYEKISYWEKERLSALEREKGGFANDRDERAAQAQVREEAIAAFKTALENGKFLDVKEERIPRTSGEIVGYESRISADNFSRADMLRQDPDLYRRYEAKIKEMQDQLYAEEVETWGNLAKNRSSFNLEAEAAAMEAMKDELSQKGYIQVSQQPIYKQTELPQMSGIQGLDGSGFGKKIKGWFDSIIAWIKEKFAGLIDFDKLGKDISKFFDFSNFKLPSFGNFFKDLNDGITQTKTNLGIDENGPGLLTSISNLIDKFLLLPDAITKAVPPLEKLITTTSNFLQVNRDSIANIKLITDNVKSIIELFDIKKQINDAIDQKTSFGGIFKSLAGGQADTAASGMFDSIGKILDKIIAIGQSANLVNITASIADMIKSFNAGGAQTNTGSFDKIITLIDKINSIDIEKIQKLMDVFTPLMSTLSGSSLLDQAYNSTADSAPEPGTIDKIITLIDKVNTFDSTKLVSGMSDAYKIFDDFLNEKTKIDGVTQSIKDLTTEVQNLKKEFSLGALGNAIVGAFGGGTAPTNQQGGAQFGPNAAANEGGGVLDTLSSIKDGILNLVGLQAQNNDHAEVTARAARDAARFSRE